MNSRKKAGAVKTAPKNRPAGISSARKAAFNILLAVERGQSHSDDLLRGKVVNALSLPDRNLATALVLGVLRWQIRLDRQLQSLLKRPNAKLDPQILIALRLGAFQLLHLDRIPARAAIDESVELAKQSGHRFASTMVNAVLRKLAKCQQTAEEPDPEGGGGINPRIKPIESTRALAPEECFPPISPEIPSFSATSLAPEGSSSEDLESHPACEAHPIWMVERWISFYGLDATRAICRHGQSQPVQAVRLAGPAVENELGAARIILEPGQLLTAARTVVAGDIAATKAFREGCVRLQDEGSQLVAELAACMRSVLNQDGQKILDTCAAPGGKTLILAERNPQARIVACESSAPRLEQLRKRLAFLGNRVEFRQADATALTEDSVFDLALADVPCSGTGTLGRNPEIRHRLRPEDLSRQAGRQRAILLAALRAVRPGGRVVYSTCSLEPEENEQVVAAVLAANPSARLVSLEAHIDGLFGQRILAPTGAERLRGVLTPEGFLRLLPGSFHTDGFFICMIERIA
jgi:16S rRNA (cytosine967-C5)-methyltransferase